MSYTLKTIFDRFDGDRAVFITPYGQEIFWPRNEIDELLENGQIRYIALCDAEDEKPHSPKIDNELSSITEGIATKGLQKEEQQSVARRMLEELLNGE